MQSLICYSYAPQSNKNTIFILLIIRIFSASIETEENKKNDINVDMFESEELTDNDTKAAYNNDATQSNNNVIREGESNTN